MNLCGIPYYYSREFEDIYFYMVDFLYVDEEIKPDYVRFCDDRIHITVAYTRWSDEIDLINSSLVIVLEYTENDIEGSVFGYEVSVYFYMTINGEVKEDNAYRRIFKNLDDVEDYNKWVEFRSHVAPWLVKFKMYIED